MGKFCRDQQSRIHWHMSSPADGAKGTHRGPNAEHVDPVQGPRLAHPAERGEEYEGKQVDRWHVGEDGVRLDALHRLDDALKHVLRRVSLYRSV